VALRPVVSEPDASRIHRDLPAGPSSSSFTIVSNACRCAGGRLMVRPFVVCSTEGLPPVSAVLRSRRRGNGAGKGIAGPTEDVQVDCIASVRATALPGAAGAACSCGNHKGSASGPVNALAVLLEPRADCAEPFDLARFNAPVGMDWCSVPGCRRDSATHQRADAIRQRFEGVVRFPGHCVPSVMQLSQGRSTWNRPMDCSGVSKSRQATTVVDDEMRLQFARQPEEIRGVPFLRVAPKPSNHRPSMCP